MANKTKATNQKQPRPAPAPDNVIVFFPGVLDDQHRVKSSFAPPIKPARRLSPEAVAVSAVVASKNLYCALGNHRVKKGTPGFLKSFAGSNSKAVFVCADCEKGSRQ